MPKTPATVDELLRMFAKQTRDLDPGAVRKLAEAAISTGQAKLEQLKVRVELEGVSMGDAKGRIQDLQTAEANAGIDYERIRTASLDKVTKITEIDRTQRDDLYLDMLDAVTGGQWR